MSFLVKAFGVFVCLVATLVICIFRILPQLGVSRQLFMDDETSVVQCWCLELLHTSEILVVV